MDQPNLDERQVVAPKKASHFPYGSIEPHKYCLEQPSNEVKLYKIISIENLLRSVKNQYLYFHRVDQYKDYINGNGDTYDGDQLPSDIPINEKIKFKKSQSFTASSYYKKSRARTYACCFSLENSSCIWERYGGPHINEKVCLVFNFGKLKAALNDTLNQCTENDLLVYKGLRLKQLFNINYGIVKYVERNKHKQIKKNLPNPIEYVFLKDKEKFEEEKELRIALSAIGMGKFVLKDQKEILFPKSLEFSFDFNKAIAGKVIEQVQVDNDKAFKNFSTKLSNLGITIS